MCKHINNVRDSVLMQFVKQENQIPRILSDILGVDIPSAYEPKYYDVSTFVKGNINFGLCCRVAPDMLVVLVESKLDLVSDLASKMLKAAGTVFGEHGVPMKPVFIVMGKSRHKQGVFVKNPYDGGPSDFSMKIHVINMRSYPDPDCNSPLWYYSDFISLVYKKMNTSPHPKAGQAIREAIDFDDSMAWFFQQKPERIAQLALEMGDPCDPDDEPDLAWAGSTI